MTPTREDDVNRRDPDWHGRESPKPPRVDPEVHVLPRPGTAAKELAALRARLTALADGLDAVSELLREPCTPTERVDARLKVAALRAELEKP